MSLGENIRRRRIQLHLSQQELADALGYKTRKHKKASNKLIITRIN